MFISYNLNNNIACEKICHDIQKLVSKFQTENKINNSLVLVVGIKEVIDVDCTPKLEYKS